MYMNQDSNFLNWPFTSSESCFGKTISNLMYKFPFFNGLSFDKIDIPYPFTSLSV